MGRPTSTVAREVGRKRGPDGYRASMAQRATDIRAARPKILKLVTDAVLAAEVAAGLVKRWFAGGDRRETLVDHPGDEAMRRETIYASLYLQGRAA